MTNYIKLIIPNNNKISRSTYIDNLFFNSKMHHVSSILDGKQSTLHAYDTKTICFSEKLL